MSDKNYTLPSCARPAGYVVPQPFNNEREMEEFFRQLDHRFPVTLPVSYRKNCAKEK